MTDTIVVQARIDVEHSLDAGAVHLRHQSTPLTRLGRKLGIGFLVFMTVVIPCDVASKIADLPPEKARREVIGYVIVLGLLWTWVYGTRPKNWFRRRALRQSLQHDPQFGSPVTFRIGAEEIQVETQHADSRVSWPSYSKIVEAEDGFLMYQGIQPVHWLPAAGFGSAEQVDRFALLAKDRVRHYVALGTCRFAGKTKPPTLDDI